MSVPFLIPVAERAPFRFADTVPPHQWGETRPRPVRFVMGVDLGQARDYSAIVINEVSLSKRQRHQPGDTTALMGQPQYVQRHSLRHVERIALGTSYPDVIATVRARFEALPAMHRLPLLIVDGTGCGRPVVDAMRETGLAPLAATITAGSAFNQPRGSENLRVAKSLLASSVAIALETGRLIVEADGPHRDTLRKELAAFRVKVNSLQNETFEAWREADHDDLVLAAALAVWQGEREQPLMAPNPAFSMWER